jgi:hypothetical protein
VKDIKVTLVFQGGSIAGDAGVVLLSEIESKTGIDQHADQLYQ